MACRDSLLRSSRALQREPIKWYLPGARSSTAQPSGQVRFVCSFVLTRQPHACRNGLDKRNASRSPSVLARGPEPDEGRRDAPAPSADRDSTRAYTVRRLPRLRTRAHGPTLAAAPYARPRFDACRSSVRAPMVRRAPTVRRLPQLRTRAHGSHANASAPHRRQQSERRAQQLVKWRMNGSRTLRQPLQRVPSLPTPKSHARQRGE